MGLLLLKYVCYDVCVCVVGVRKLMCATAVFCIDHCVNCPREVLHKMRLYPVLHHENRVNEVPTFASRPEKTIENRVFNEGNRSYECCTRSMHTDCTDVQCTDCTSSNPQHTVGHDRGQLDQNVEFPGNLLPRGR